METEVGPPLFSGALGEGGREAGGALGRAGGCFVLCTDALARGGAGGGMHDFPWTLLLLKMLKSRKPVAVVSANHAREHYELVLRRHGLDAVKLEAAGLFKVYILSFANEGNGDTTSWADLVQHLTAGSPKCLFFDDLEALEALSPAPRAQQRALIARMFAQLGDAGRADTLVAFGRRTDLSLEEKDGEPSLCDFCSERAHVNIRVEPLSSGRSNDAHGIVTITFVGSPPESEERYTFKVTSSDSVTFSLAGRC